VKPQPQPARAAEEAEDVASPCINICRMNPATKLCDGCLRTLDEIAEWSGYNAEEKRAVLAKLAVRRAAESR